MFTTRVFPFLYSLGLLKIRSTNFISCSRFLLAALIFFVFLLPSLSLAQEEEVFDMPEPVLISEKGDIFQIRF